MEIFASFFAAGFLFWSILTVLFIVLVFMSEKELWGWTFFTFIIGLLGVQFLTELSPFGYAWRNPVNILSGFIAYFIIGIIWSYFKWGFFLGREVDKFKQYKRRFLEKHNISGDKVPSNLLKEFAESIRGRHYNTATNKENVTAEDIREWITPRPRDYKEKIMYWIAWWPTSLVWTMFDDPLKYIAESIYRGIGESLHRVAKRRFKKIDLSEFE